MSIKKYFLLPLALLIASALSGQTTLLNDSFTSGTGTGATGYLGKSGAGNAGTPGVQNLPSSAFWFGNNSTYSSTSGAGASAESYNTGSGLLIPNANTTQSVSAFFESPGNYQTLAVGDTLTMTFNFTLGTAPTYQATGIRFQLINSASTSSSNNQLTANVANSGGSRTNTTNWSGYFVGFDAGTTATTGGISTIYNRKSGFSPNLIASSPTQLSTAAPGPTPGLNTTDTYQAKLTLLYTGSAINAGFSVSDVTTSTALGTYTLNVTDTGTPNALITSFDGFTIGELSGENTPMTISNVTVTYTPEPTAATPTFSPVAGTYTSAQSVTLSTTTPGASIVYTVTAAGQTPVTPVHNSSGAATTGTLYTGPFLVGTNATVQAIAFETTPTPYGDSPVGTAAYVINNATKAAQPTFSPGAGTVNSGTTVTLSTITVEGSIAYTTDGSTPTESGGRITNGTLYSGPIPITATTTINAIGFIGGLTDSVLGTASYNISTMVAAPAFSPGGGAVASGTTVTISSGTSGASIAYTTDGSTPTEVGGSVANGTLYSGPIPITGATTVNAIGFKSLLLDSTVSSAGYTTFTLPSSLAPLPSSQVVTSGKTVILTASATGNPAPTFQWQQSADSGKTWATITGQTGTTLTVTAGPSLGTVQYRYVATNSGGSTNSNVCSLIVNPALFPSPTCIVVDSSGNLYAGDSSNNTIQQINASGVVRLVAGSTAGTAGSTDGIGSAALFRDPTGIIITPDMTMLYVADTGNSAIRQITPGGVVTTLAVGLFNAPVGVAVDTSGNLYVADSNNKVIRMVTKAGVGSTFAGPPAALFNAPYGLAVNNTSGNLYASDTNTLLQVTAGGVKTLAGTSAPALADGTGSNAGFTSPGGLAVDSAGNIYVADTGNSTIRKVTPAGAVTTFAGQAGKAGLLDGTGSNALFNKPEDLTVDTSGNVYVADTLNGAIRKITPAGVVTTLVLTTASNSPSSASPSSTSASSTSGGGAGAMDAWFLGCLAFAGLLRWRLRKT